MVHYTCDLCGCKISQDDPRYIVDIDIEAATPEDEPEDGFLAELEADIPCTDDFCDLFGSECVEDDLCTRTFDLCQKCRDSYIDDPLFKKRYIIDRKKHGYSCN